MRGVVMVTYSTMFCSVLSIAAKMTRGDNSVTHIVSTDSAGIVARNW